MDGNFTKLRFRRWNLTEGLSLSAVLPQGHGLCGIYVLEFANGEEYVGQTVSLLARVSTHRRRWRDIVALRFATVPRSDLDRTEADVIARLAAGGIRLRNKDLIQLPLRGDALDLVVDQAVQEEWIRGHSGDIHIGNRAQEAERRRRTRRNFDRLAAHAEFEDIVSFAAYYVMSAIPWPHQTEGTFWTVTSMASTGRSRDWRRLAVVNINNVEMLVIGEQGPIGAAQVCGFMNLAVDVSLPRELGPWIARGRYRSVGEVQRIEFASLQDAVEMLEYESVEQATRLLAMGLLRKGKGMLAKYHDYNLADELYLRMASLIGP